METLGEIATAIDQIEIEKQNLHKSFLHLQSQSPSSSDFNLTLNWNEFDSYFTTLTSSLRHKFHLLQTLNPPSVPTTPPNLAFFCHNSDGLGLRNFIHHKSHRRSILAQLTDAYLCAPDPAAMVLDAMAGFCTGKNPELRLVREACFIMLEALVLVQPEIRVELREKAMEVAYQWNLEKAKSFSKDKKLYAYGFLLLVEAYGLIDRFSIEDFISCIVIIAKRSEAIGLCRKMIPENKINDLIQELISKNLQVSAAKFIIEFKKTDEFSHVNLLEERKEMCMRIVDESRKKGKAHQNAVIVKEIIALKSIIQCIDEYGIESEFPKDAVIETVDKLENDPVCAKRQAYKKERSLKKKMRKLNNFLEPHSQDDVEDASMNI